MPPHRRRHRHGIGTASALILAAEHLSRGAAGVIIDHHRNPDTGSQEYVDNISSGQSLLDAAIAARGLGVDPAAPVGLHGYSQGGGTSGWVAENAHVYARDLNDGGRRWLDASDGLCVGGSIFDSGFRSTKDFTATGESLKEVIFERYPFIIDELERQELGKRTPTHPTMLYAGVHDDIIPVNQIRKIRDAWTAGGADLKYVEDPTTSIPGKTAANHIVPMLSQLIPSIDFMWSHLAPGHQPTIPGMPGSLTPTLPGAPELPGASAPGGRPHPNPRRRRELPPHRPPRRPRPCRSRRRSRASARCRRSVSGARSPHRFRVGVGCPEVTSTRPGCWGSR